MPTLPPWLLFLCTYAFHKSPSYEHVSIHPDRDWSKGGGYIYSQCCLLCLLQPCFTKSRLNGCCIFGGLCIVNSSRPVGAAASRFSGFSYNRIYAVLKQTGHWCGRRANGQKYPGPPRHTGSCRVYNILMPNGNGFEVMTTFLREPPVPQHVAISGQPRTGDLLSTAKLLSATLILPKPACLNDRVGSWRRTRDVVIR